MLLSSYIFEIYNLGKQHSKREILINILIAVSLSFIILSIMFYIEPGLKLGRGLLIISLATFVMYQFTWHLIFSTAAGLPFLAARIIILGTGDLAKRIGDLIVYLLNGSTRLIDRSLKTRTGIYGWGFVFGKPGTELDPLPSYFNVCSKCGAGCPFACLAVIRKWGLKFYECPLCKGRNLLFQPPEGFE